jgi:hypothetical protein
MSITAMNWAWKQALTPTAKLVLMSLADMADDQGVCWPSIPRLAQKCTLSSRTVQRILQELVTAALLRVEPRFRADGSRTSNRYYLTLEGGDNLSLAPVTADGGPLTALTGAPDTADTPRITTRTPIEPPLPPNVARSTGAHRRGGIDKNQLLFPSQFSEAEQRVAEKLLQCFPEALA